MACKLSVSWVHMRTESLSILGLFISLFSYLSLQTFLSSIIPIVILSSVSLSCAFQLTSSSALQSVCYSIFFSSPLALCFSCLQPTFPLISSPILSITAFFSLWVSALLFHLFLITSPANVKLLESVGMLSSPYSLPSSALLPISPPFSLRLP